MSNKIDWNNLPYDHSGRWESKYDSIMNPGKNCTFPQLIAQWVIQTRMKHIKAFPKIIRGPGWSNAISRQVRGLIQQASVLTRYFPHPDDDQYVFSAFRTYFEKNLVFKIGQHRKTRVTKKGKLNITNDEKDVIKGIMCVYNDLKKRYSVVKKPTFIPETIDTTIKKVENPPTRSRFKGKLSSLIELDNGR